ncbi:MAG: efflux transporter periplasmic adaptor subunit, partial [Spirosomaceae bacterium]|nr:efflux transporter periplasmic adaptor subunit [Spirosomataceae bacterium]
MMQKQIYPLLFIGACWVGLTACSKSESKDTQAPESYQVTSPATIDTVYNVDYVADINSVRNVEIRARVK